jgi:hypothetical protein
MRPLWLALGFALSACLSPPGPAERATDAARSLNVAARFGRMDVANALLSKELKRTFIEHRAEWGKDVRVLDVELTSFNMPASDHADVEVSYSWSRADDPQLRTTRIQQEWRDPGGGFRLFRERRIGGDTGLFGEPVPKVARAAPRDVQFNTKVIRESE